MVDGGSIHPTISVSDVENCLREMKKIKSFNPKCKTLVKGTVHLAIGHGIIIQPCPVHHLNPGQMLDYSMLFYFNL